MAKLIYKTDEKLPVLPFLLYGLQWLLVTIPSIVIIGAVVAKFHYESLSAQVFYTQKLFAVIGIGLFLQVLWGHKMAIVMGPASVLLIGILAAGSTSLNATYTAILLGGLLMIAVAYVKPILQKIPAIFTGRIIVVILALIAFTLMPTIIRLIFNDEMYSFFLLLMTLSSLFFMLLANKWLKGVWKSTVVLWGLVLGTTVYNLFIKVPISTEVAVSESYSFFIFPLEFDMGLLLSFLFCYVALFINELGSIQGVGKAVEADQMPEKTSRGLFITGGMNSIAGLLGVIGPVDFSFSPGVILSTGCASRYALLPAAGILIVTAFFPSLILFFTQIPTPIMGIILLYLMVLQLAAALQLLKQEKQEKIFEQFLILAVPLMLALFISFLPEAAKEEVPTLLQPILGNGFVVGVMTVLVMEHVAYRKKKGE